VPKELFFMPCPTFETLIDFIDGRLVSPESGEVERHLADGCAACESAVEWHMGFARTAAADTSFDPPEWVMRRAVSLFADARDAAARRGIRGVLNRLRAALVFDSLAGFAGGLDDAIPARNAATESAAADRRQLLYSVPPYDVDLLVTPSGASNDFSVTGQILASEESDFARVGGLTVEFTRGAVVVATVETSEFGEFTVQGLPGGTYDVRIVGNGREIVVPEAPLTLR
jgi:hypothetical protein